MSLHVELAQDREPFARKGEFLRGVLNVPQVIEPPGFGSDGREVLRQLADVGRTLGSPWRGDEKSAALAAWMTLTTK